MDLPSDWSEFLRLLSSNRVRYLVVGAHALAAEVEAFATPDRMATLGQPPLRIDVMTSISGVTFAEAWRTRMAGKMGPHRVFFLGREALIRNKRASGRTKDLLDIALLEEGDSTTAPKARARKATAPKRKPSKAKPSEPKPKTAPRRR